MKTEDDIATPDASPDDRHMIHVVVATWASDEPDAYNGVMQSVWAYVHEEHADAKYEEIAAGVIDAKSKGYAAPGFNLRRFALPLESSWQPIEADDFNLPDLNDRPKGANN